MHLGAKVHSNPDLAIRKWERDTEMKKTEKKRQNNSVAERLNSINFLPNRLDLGSNKGFVRLSG